MEKTLGSMCGAGGAEDDTIDKSKQTRTDWIIMIQYRDRPAAQTQKYYNSSKSYTSSRLPLVKPIYGILDDLAPLLLFSLEGNNNGGGAAQ